MQSLGVEVRDSRDTFGRYRFLPFVPEKHIIMSHANEEWYWKYLYYPQKQVKGLQHAYEHEFRLQIQIYSYLSRSLTPESPLPIFVSFSAPGHGLLLGHGHFLPLRLSQPNVRSRIPDLPPEALRDKSSAGEPPGSRPQPNNSTSHKLYLQTSSY
jgi:hypothetical protein